MTLCLDMLTPGFSYHFLTGGSNCAYIFLNAFNRYIPYGVAIVLLKESDDLEPLVHEIVETEIFAAIHRIGKLRQTRDTKILTIPVSEVLVVSSLDFPSHSQVADKFWRIYGLHKEVSGIQDRLDRISSSFKSITRQLPQCS